MLKVGVAMGCGGSDSYPIEEKNYYMGPARLSLMERIRK